MVSIYHRQKLGAAEHLFNLKNNYYFYFYVVRQKLIFNISSDFSFAGSQKFEEPKYLGRQNESLASTAYYSEALRDQSVIGACGKCGGRKFNVSEQFDRKSLLAEVIC